MPFRRSINCEVMETARALHYARSMQTLTIGNHLREWRQRRRLSQLDLALEAEISTKHLSFLETGRAQPSRDMVLKLAEQLDVPLRERNVLLVSAGYAPVNVLRLSLHPEGLAPRIENLAEWRAHLLARLRQQIDATADGELAKLM